MAKLGAMLVDGTRERRTVLLSISSSFLNPASSGHVNNRRLMAKGRDGRIVLRPAIAVREQINPKESAHYVTARTCVEKLTMLDGILV